MTGWPDDEPNNFVDDVGNICIGTFVATGDEIPGFWTLWLGVFDTVMVVNDFIDDDDDDDDDDDNDDDVDVDDGGGIVVNEDDDKEVNDNVAELTDDNVGFIDVDNVTGFIDDDNVTGFIDEDNIVG